MPRLRGAYSTVVMTKRAVVAFRDPYGVRPLSLGKLGDRYCVASESCAFDIIGAELLREISPGEMVVLGEGGIETRQVLPSEQPAHCVFEHIYFSRPDTRLEGRVLQEVRGRMGEILAREAPADADLVISVPDSGNPAANGFARESGLPKDDGLIKNRYVQRTFIQPGQELRKHGLRMKFNPLPEIVSGKRVVVVDDSIVRGNTTRQIVGHAPRRRGQGGPPADLGTADPLPLPLRGGHVHERGDDRPRPRAARGGGRGRRGLAGLPLPRGRLRGGRHPARAPLRRLLLRSTTRSATTARATASSPSKSCRSSARRRLAGANRRPVGHDELMALDLDAALLQRARSPRLPPRATGGRGGGGCAPRRAAGDADGRGQVGLLPAPGAARPPSGRRRLAARLADGRPGGEPRGTRRADQRPARPGPRTGRRSSGRSPARPPCSTWRRSASGRRGSSSGCARRRSACSSSTRPTASASGGTTSGPTTSAWATWRARSARARSSPRRPPRRRGSRTT